MKHPTTRQTREQRAAVFFALYAQITTNRSLEALHVTATGLGLPVKLNTLKDYSRDFGWQERVKVIDSDRAALAASPAARVATMNETQAHVGEMLIALAQAGAEKLAERIDELSPTDIRGLYRDGVHGQRLAMGEATERQEIEVRVYTELIERIAVLFVEVNGIAEAEERAKRFALGADSLISAHIAGDPVEVREIDDSN